MNLYDELIRSYVETTSGSRSLSTAAAGWPQSEKSEIIMRREMAFELGGGTKEALSALAITEDAALVPQDEILLLGPDLLEIRTDCSCARLALVRVKEASLGEGDRMYGNIRAIEYVRYHVRPKGYMIRVSSTNAREPVRVAKEAVKKGISFADVGRSYLDAYHRNPLIEAVKLIFITKEDFDYKALKKEIGRNESVTKAIDHVLKDLKMDCAGCADRQLCEEIEKVLL